MAVKWHIQDFGLSALQLEAKHAPDGDDEHSGYQKWEWRHEVTRGKTLAGYWVWVKEQIDAEEEELEQCSPWSSMSEYEE